jgi:hypothetical protein
MGKCFGCRNNNIRMASMIKKTGRDGHTGLSQRVPKIGEGQVCREKRSFVLSRKRLVAPVCEYVDINGLWRSLKLAKSVGSCSVHKSTISFG